jgi:signal peptidase I
MTGLDRSAPEEQAPNAPAPPWPRNRRPSPARDYAPAVLVALFCTLVIRIFVLQAFRIPSASMEDTLAIGDYLFVNKLVFGPRVPFLSRRLPGLRSPVPGDVIVFKYPLDPTKDYIKRCIAVAGQEVEIRDQQVWVDGRLSAEPYVKFSDSSLGPGERGHFGPLTVPAGQLFVLGDNRDLSHDSRAWGMLDQRLVLGRASLIYWSWDRDRKLFGWLPAPRWGRIGARVR